VGGADNVADEFSNFLLKFIKRRFKTVFKTAVVDSRSEARGLLRK
jgi:hypothetical protein